MAATLIHHKDLENDTLEEYLHIIREHSDDHRVHVKKAISWALREIGKKNFDCQERALLLAHEFCEGSNKNRAWIGRNAVKEIERLVSIKERGRLISSTSKMGKLNSAREKSGRYGSDK